MNISSEPKLEKDYQDYNQTIELKAQEEIKKIREKITMVKKEAEKIGETLESSLGEGQVEE